jgi:hypothetical protein
MRYAHIALAGLLGCSLAACGAGGSGAASPSLPTVRQPAGPEGQATFVVRIPKPVTTGSGTKRPAYLTPQVQGIDFSVTSNPPAGTATPAPPVGRGYVFYPLTSTSSYCSNGPTALTCTLAVQAYPGNDLFTVNTYDQPYPNSSYAYPYSAVVSTGFVTATILPNVANTINVTTSGVPMYIFAALDNQEPPVGTALTQPIHIIAADNDANLIIGPYDLPITLSDSDTSGATTLSAATITSSATVPQLIYNGGSVALPGAYIGGTTMSPSTAYNGGPYAPTTVFYPGGTAVRPTPTFLQFSHANAVAQTVTLGGAGTSAPYSLAINDCSGIVSVSGSGPTFAVTPIHAGGCLLQAGDASKPNVNWVAILVSP